MTINFYKTSDDKRKLSKTLSNVKTNVSGQIYDDTSIISPSFIVETDDDLFEANYLYIAKFNRYYYIENITVLKGNHLLITTSVDVLMSYKDDINNITCTIVRNPSQSNFNLYLDDGHFKVYNYPRIQTFKFPNALSKTMEYVLTVAGG